jgi:hypothetical protein
VVSLPDGASSVALDIGIECMSEVAARATGSVNSCRGLVQPAGLSSPCAAAMPPRLFSNSSEVPFMFSSVEKTEFGLANRRFSNTDQPPGDAAGRDRGLLRGQPRCAGPLASLRGAPPPWSAIALSGTFKVRESLDQANA